MPLNAAHQRTSRPSAGNDRVAGKDLFAAYLAETKGEFSHSPKINETILEKGIAAADPETQIAVARAAIAHLAKFARTLKKEDINYHGRAGYSGACVKLLRFLFRRKLPYSETMLAEIAEMAVTFPHIDLYLLPYMDGLVRTIEFRTQQNSLSPRMAKALRKLIGGLGEYCNAPESRLRGRVLELLKRGSAAPETNVKVLASGWTRVERSGRAQHLRPPIRIVRPTAGEYRRRYSSIPNWPSRP